MLMMLRKHGFRVYFIGEFNTSSICPIRPGYRLKYCHKVSQPRPYGAVDKKTRRRIMIKCYCLLSCKNPNCMKGVPLRKPTPTIPRRYWNRDLTAVRSFKIILESIFAGIGIPERSRRCHRDSALPARAIKQ
ncbi:hypothetical protein BX070DRAFT_228090 [Coemansia spiralis]|nr:hypothetical protein BX070DRAFT_228090 [Coemansia spiralis]